MFFVNPPVPLFGHFTCKTESIGACYLHIDKLAFKIIAARKVYQLEAVGSPLHAEDPFLLFPSVSTCLTVPTYAAFLAAADSLMTSTSLLKR